MIRKFLSLGQTPLVRRLIAAIILCGAALIRALLGNGDEVQFWIDLGSGIFMAVLALGFLHFRWRKREAKEISPAQIRDTFS